MKLDTDRIDEAVPALLVPGLHAAGSHGVGARQVPGPRALRASASTQARTAPRTFEFFVTVSCSVPPILQAREPILGQHRTQERRMDTHLDPTIRNDRFELRFQSLFDSGRALVFPCDAAGQVDIDALSPRARDRYLWARALIGREFGYPKACPSYVH
jgi:hypothetical protein